MIQNILDELASLFKNAISIPVISRQTAERLSLRLPRAKETPGDCTSSEGGISANSLLAQKVGAKTL